MYRNKKVLGNEAITQFDVLIVGSGAGGSAAAAVLTAHGKRVLILEAGSNYFEGLDEPDSQVSTLFSNDELKMVHRNFIQPDPVIDPRTFRKDTSEDRSFIGDVNSLPKTLGGGAVHASLNTPRFLPTDFKLGTFLGKVSGANFADWPVDYDGLEPFYDYAERTIGVAGVVGANPFEGPRKNPFPMAPGVPMYLGLKASDAASKLGYHPFPYPTAINSRPYRGRPACVDCGFCNYYACAIGAKGSPAVTFLRDALLSGNCQVRCETRVTRLCTSPSRREIVAVEALDPEGKPVVFRADRYVLAASAIEDARLLLLSDPGVQGIGNSNGVVGRNLTFHFQTFAIGIFEERLHGNRGRAVSHGMADFRGTPGDPERPMGGIIEFGGGDEPIDEVLNYVQSMGLNAGFAGHLAKQSPLRDRMLVLTMHGEDAPQLTNRIDLDPEVKDLDGLPVARVTYKNHDYELKARNFYGPKMMEIVKTAGAKYGILAPADNISMSRHVMGTLRFGNDPATSVCDANGRFHEVENLYAADGSLFPTSSGYNPTLTIMALASRVAAVMIDENSPEKMI
jgi:choline dehydrogenase-like flavoprotein